MTGNPDFKGTPLFDAEYQKRYVIDTWSVQTTNRKCCAVRVMHNTTNYKLKWLIYICQSVHSFPIGCGDVLVA